MCDLGYLINSTLSYIRGPLVKDWVITQAVELKKCINPATTGHIAKTDEVLWCKFKATFKSAWGTLQKPRAHMINL
jgi:hypothetical protein